ncbi:MAG: exosortase C-terminal domain/associated protein EpsI [Terriglobales bacterium]
MPNHFGFRCAALAAVLLLTLAGMAVFLHPAAPPPSLPLGQFPMQLGSWRGQALPMTAETLTALHLHDYVNRVYFGPDQRAVGLYIAYYPRQTYGDDIHSPKHCLPGTGWQPISTGALTVLLAGRTIQVNRYLVARGSERELILYWYQQQGRVIRSEYWSKLFQVWDGLREHRSDAALVRVALPAPGDAAAANAEGAAFIRMILPHLGGFIPD